MKATRRNFLKFLSALPLPGALTIVSSTSTKAEVGMDRKSEQQIFPNSIVNGKIQPCSTGQRYEKAGETQNWMKAKVFDADTGEELKHVVEADERTGRVVQFALDTDGNIRHTSDDILHETVYRRVRIERPT